MNKTKIAVDVFNKHAEKYQDKFMDTSLYHDTLDLFCKTIAKEDATILELACGPGNITKYLLTKHPALKILGTDLAPNMLSLARANNPTASFQLMDCRNISLLDKKYDAIMCGFCLPYLSKEEVKQLIVDASELLHPDGVFYLSTMEDDYNKSGLEKSSSGDEIYMHYHQADYLKEFLGQNHFNVVSILRKEYITNNETKTTDLIIIAKRQDS